MHYNIMLSKYYYYVYGWILWMAASGLRLIQKVITFCVMLAVVCLLFTVTLFRLGSG